MQTGKFLSFLLKSITVGLAVAFVVLFLRPDLLIRDPRIVEFKETPRPAPRTLSTLPAGQGGAPVSYAGAVQLAAPAVVNIKPQ